MVRFGTKCPSITSTWIQSAPADSTARTSSPSLAKSAERIEGATSSGRIAFSGRASGNTRRGSRQRDSGTRLSDLAESLSIRLQMLGNRLEQLGHQEKTEVG